MTHPPGPNSQYQRTPLSAEEKTRGEANLAPFVAQVLAVSYANGRDIVITFGQQEAPALA